MRSSAPPSPLPPLVAVQRAQAESPFLAGLITRHPQWAARIGGGAYDVVLSSAKAVTDDDAGKMLRQRRQGIALVTALADLAGAWDLGQVTATLSNFADEALDIAIAAAFAELELDGGPRGFAVIALGKHGGGELNYSSDIDPIFLFDPEILPSCPGKEPQQTAIHIGKRVIELLQRRTGEGYVFRVDMRLRPYPEISSVALSFKAAAHYYKSSAAAWEQAAFIRARAAAGDRALGERFLRHIEGFVWRRSLDFGQLDHIRNMSAKIRDQFSEGQALGAGYDLKRGRGGIRECEFFVQVQQLIHGGRDPDLRLRDTRRALAALVAAGHVKPEDAAIIRDGYTALRMAEHRLQMIDDRQTHALPDSTEALDAVGRLSGYADGAAFISMLAPHVRGVADCYDALVGEDTNGAPAMPQAGLPLNERLEQLGFADTASPKRWVARWRSGKLRTLRSDAARDAFENVMPAMLQALAAAPDPDRAFARLDSVLEKLPSAINIFTLLDARPALFDLLMHILSFAPTLADALAGRADYLDCLIDPDAIALPHDAPSLAADMAAKTANFDYETTLDHVRMVVGERRFALGAQLLRGQYSPPEVSQGYADLAEAAILTLARATLAEFQKAHGRIEGGELVILAMGRLGGHALTHASDLDLVMLFTGDPGARSDGPRALGATRYFNSLAQRVVAALSVRTAAGALYEVDTRLRPSGAQGMLCVSLASFARYHRESAWTWEQLALTRARPVFGSESARAQVDSEIATLRAIARNHTQALHDVREMRRTMDRHKPAKGSLDIKLLPGGLVDAEFIVQTHLLLGTIAPETRIERAIATLEAGEHLAPGFGDAAAQMQDFLLLLRLVAPDCDDPPAAAQTQIAGNLGFPEWRALIEALDAARQTVTREWNVLFGTR